VTTAAIKPVAQAQIHIDARVIALILFAATILTRLPFTTQYLYHWDSVNMAYGIIDFNVLEGAPHFPGYIVYIAIAQLVNRIFNDPQTTMVVISIVSSGLAVAAIFYLGRAMFNTATGLIAALFTMTSPLVWFYGEIALPHTLDLFAITFSALLLYKIMEGETRLMPIAAVVLALVGGFRQQDLLFLGPLILFSIYRAGLRRIIVFIVIAAAVCFAWFIPMIQYSGGLQNYMALSSSFSQDFWDTTSVLHGAGVSGIRNNLMRIIPYTAYALLLAGLPLLYWLPQIRHWQSGLRSRKFWFLALWLLPTLLFYTFIHMGQQGLVFVYMPVLFLLSAEALYQLFKTRPSVLWGTSGVIALVSAVVFVLGPTYPLGADQFKMLTYSTLRENDDRLAGKLAAVRDQFDPQNTLLISTDWRHLEYYLGEFTQVRMAINDAGAISDNDETLPKDYVGKPYNFEQFTLEANPDWHVVVMDEELMPYSADTLEVVEAPGGSSFGYLTLNDEQSIEFTPEHIAVVQ
jgi:hypothetical protein